MAVIAMKHRDTGNRVVVEGLEGVIQRGGGVGIHGIAHIRAAQCHDGH